MSASSTSSPPSTSPPQETVAAPRMSGRAWVMSAYVVGYGGFMLLGGRAADLFGRRRMFLFWLTVFLLFSGLGGFADDGPTLIVARFVTGVAAAFMTLAGLSIITTGLEEGPQRDKALLV